MIVTNLTQLERYRGLSPRLDRAIDFLRQTPVSDLLALPLGKTELDEDDEVIVLRQSYTALAFSEGILEGHREYIDIQLVLSGREQIGYLDISRAPELIVKSDYLPEADVIKYIPTSAEQLFLLSPGMLVIVYPEDLHHPKVMFDALPVEKLVVKVRL